MNYIIMYRNSKIISNKQTRCRDIGIFKNIGGRKPDSIPSPLHSVDMNEILSVT